MTRGKKLDQERGRARTRTKLEPLDYEGWIVPLRYQFSDKSGESTPAMGGHSGSWEPLVYSALADARAERDRCERCGLHPDAPRRARITVTEIPAAKKKGRR